MGMTKGATAMRVRVSLGAGSLLATPTGLVHSPDGELVVVDSGQLSPVLTTYRTSDGSEPFPPTGRTDGANGTDALVWIDEERLHLGAGSAKGVATYDLTTGEQVGFIGELILEDVVYSPTRREIVAVGSDRLQFRSTIGAGPLERVALLSNAQRDAVVGEGGTVHTSISADGTRLIVSALGAGFSVPPTTSFDLTTEPMSAGDFPFDDRLAFGNGSLTVTVTVAPFVLDVFDEFDRPLASIPLSLDTTDQDVSADGRFIVTARVGGTVDVYDGSGVLLQSLDMDLPESDSGRIVIPSLSDDGAYFLATSGRGQNAIWSTDTFERIDDGTIRGRAGSSATCSPTAAATSSSCTSSRVSRRSGRT
jgi:hypothetical protein